MTEFYDRQGDTTIAHLPVEALDAPIPTGDDPSIATIHRLSTELARRAEVFAGYEAYYNGHQGNRFVSVDRKLAFSKTFGSYAENVCALVVDAVEERLDVVGFRFPPQDDKKATTPVPTDPVAWRIWQDNQLDAESPKGHKEALIKSVVYVLVSPFESERIAGRSPRITIEDPCETFVEFAPGGRERLVGIKRWYDATVARTYATLYFPDRIEKWQTAVRSGANQHGPWIKESQSWERRLVLGETWPLPNDLGIVPLIPLVNRPRLRGDGRSEIEDITPIQDAINKLATDALITSDTASFPQKWATGLEIPKDPLTGKDIETYQASVDRFISTSAPDAKFGQFEAAKLEGYNAAIDQKYQAVATISQTPFHYFQQHSGQPPSGDSLRSSETGLVRKTRRKQRHFGEGWEEVMRLAFKSLGDPRGDVLDSEAQWADAESLTEAEHTDSLIKRRAGLKVPFKKLWEDQGYSPAEIAQFPAMLAEEASWLAGTLAAPIEPDGAKESIQEVVDA